MERCNVGLLVASSVGLLVLVALVPISRLGHVRIPGEAALLLGIFTELTAIMSLLVLVIGQMAWTIRTYRNPIAPLFGLTRADMVIYAPHAAELGTYEAIDLKWVRNQLTLQHEAFDRRRYFLTGPIDKIGIVPVVIGALTAIPKIVEQFKYSVPNYWIWDVVGVCACFYLAVWLTHRNGTRLGFAVNLIESAIDLKEAEGSKKPGEEPI